ncbi:hypothetical protein X275_01245 [Marinitoga sp. 1197]|uniref:sigma-70 family RNA polymerase sigma factor n=1 Tax=Marinitoga sp. 1197 TaxID=1428449 RepID=UPI0006411BB0|nr:sigma-70 family RNA polymerase sigma factor [Marinitoga sp. 1197]AJW76898.1 hypothetical protein UF08_9 [Marinitoga camini virus 1]KLO24046.1 hypothetical protein X275_01245 [Marinitoga sp. 1197]
MNSIVDILKEVQITEEDIILILQKYKPALQKIMGKQVNLDFYDDEIHVQEKFKSDEFGKIKSFGALKIKDFNAMIKDGIPKEFVDALVIVKVVEEWLELLTTHEKKVIFWRYINHDFEKDKKYYKTISYEKIGEKLNMSKVGVYKIVKNSLRKIKRHNNI